MKRKQKVILTIQLLVSLLINGQEWTYYKDFPNNISTKEIVLNDAGTLFLWTSDNRFFYKTITNGSWIEFSNEQSNSPINPRCISVDKSSNRFYVGDSYSGGLYYTSDYGLTWQQSFFANNTETGLHEPITKLSNIKNQNRFYGATIGEIGSENMIVKYTNSGQQAEFIEYDPSMNPDNAISELFYTTNQKLLIGTKAGGIWVGDNNGTSFNQSNFNHYKISCFTEDSTGRVYALGNDENAGTPFLIYSDNYIDWQYIALPNQTEHYTTIHYDLFSQNLWLGSETKIYKTTIINNATSIWYNALFNNGEQSEIKIIGDNNGNLYNFSKQKIAQKLNAEGDNWININNGLSGTITKALFNSNNQIFASNYTTNNISIALNQFADWTNVNIGGNNNSGIRNMFMTTNGILYVNTGAKIKKSTNSGLTYTDITPQNTNYIFQFYVGEAGDLFIVNFNQQDTVYHSTDQGQSWSLLQTFPSFFSFFPDPIKTIAQDSNGVIYVTMSTIEIFSGIYKIYYSTNGGLTWNTKVIDDPNIDHYDVAVFTKNNKTFVQLGGFVYSFNYDQPNDLVIVNAPSVFDHLNYLWVDNLDNYYIYDSGLYKSSDGGENWTYLGKPDSLPTDAMIDDLLFDSNNRAYIVASHTTLPSQRGFYYVSELLSVENPVNKNDWIVFPVPAENTLNLNTYNQIKKVSIYDMLGKKIEQIDNPTNTIDISKLASGNYLLSIHDFNSQVRSVKFIKK